MQTAIDGGINFFDTAEMYGDGASEVALGKALGAQRDAVLIASKVSPQHCTPAGLREACEGSLQRLGTDRLDLYQIHWPFDGASKAAVAETLLALQAEGKIRYIGVSNFGVEDMAAWAPLAPTVSNQLGYNLIFRAIEYEITLACREHGLGVIAYMPLMQGLLTGRWETVEEIPVLRRRTRHFSGKREACRHGERGCESLLMETVLQIKRFSEAVGLSPATMSLCWAIAQPGVSSVIIGGRKPGQLRRNLEAADLDIGPAGIAQLNEISGPLKTHMGPNADMWQSGEHARVR